MTLDGPPWPTAAIGKTLARKIRNTGAASETPNQRIASGIQAIGEIGRSTWIKPG